MEWLNNYLELGDHFFERSVPTPVRDPILLLWNRDLAKELRLPELLTHNRQELAQLFVGNQRLPGCEPIALAYSGHQFGHFSPLLGDGRAHLLGQVIDQQGVRRDVQLKGSGPTRFSRRGDGRCALGPAIREYIMGEAMHALNVPTSRSLAVVATGEFVYREGRVPGAVVTRVASSHLRVGSFQYLAAHGDINQIENLVDFSIETLYPDLQGTGQERFLGFIDQVMERQIDLVVEWMRVGFIHGVLNTDNTTISGETLDFGPCAMMGVYDPDTVFSSIDHQGRYAFGNQPHILQWNMARLAETLLPLIDSDEKAAAAKATKLIHTFPRRFEEKYYAMLGKKLGFSRLQLGDRDLIKRLLNKLYELKLDYTVIFDQLTYSLFSDSLSKQLQSKLGDWFDEWKKRVMVTESAQKLMRSQNPVVIPRNHHMEAVIAAAVEEGDMKPALSFIEVLKQPYLLLDDTYRYQDTPEDGDLNYQTFCGT